MPQNPRVNATPPDSDINTAPARSISTRLLGAHRALPEILAVLISGVSIWIAFGANSVQERMLAANVWPHLSFITDNQRGDKRSIQLTIGNSGTGPLLLEVFNVTYANQPIHNSDEMLTNCCGSPEQRVHTSSEPAAGRVIRPGETIDIMTLPEESANDAVWKKFNRERYKVQVQACYCSVLKDCWKIDATDPQVGREHVESVRKCPDMDVTQMWKG